MALTSETRRAAGVEASEFMSSLGTIVRWLKRQPLPLEAEELRGLQPKPRHIGALLLVAHDEGLSVSDLADRLHVSLATASQLVSDLVDLGLVQRVEDPADRRRTLIEVTGEHRPLVDSVLRCRVAPLQAAMDQMSPEDRAGLLTGLKSLAAHLDSHDTDGTERTS